MKVQGSAFFFGSEVNASDAKFAPFLNWVMSVTAGSTWPAHRPHGPEFSHRREIFIKELNDSWCGVIISARTTDFHHFVRRQGNVITIEARPTAGNPPVEVNFFCMRKDSFKGIYSHYWGSYALNGFLWDLWKSYRHFVEERCTLALVGIDEPDVVKREYSMRGKSNTSPLFSPKAFAAMVRQLSEVSEVRLTTYNIDGRDDQPVANRLRNVHKVYRLQEDHQRADKQLFRWIDEKRTTAMRYLKNGEPTVSGSVLGKDSSGLDLTVLFGNNLDNHLNFNYDDIGTFNVDAIDTNPCLVEMLAKLRDGIMFRR